eukprot:750620-Hanusia_phi.AAC.5
MTLSDDFRSSAGIGLGSLGSSEFDKARYAVVNSDVRAGGTWPRAAPRRRPPIRSVRLRVPSPDPADRTRRSQAELRGSRVPGGLRLRLGPPRSGSLDSESDRTGPAPPGARAGASLRSAAGPHRPILPGWHGAGACRVRDGQPEIPAGRPPANFKLTSPRMTPGGLREPREP